jgi:phosphoenolpyruvate phosphomutase / 2-hydroxyethylphosphonate cytidylyltransferase
MDKFMKKVYIVMSIDIIQPAHINIIKKASELGELTVGVLTDKAISSYKKIPFMRFDQRKLIFENIKGVSNVVAQETTSYVDNITKLKPDFVVHGDDWKKGVLSNTRKELVDLLEKIGGELIEFPYSKNFTADLQGQINPTSTTPSIRLSMLRRLLSYKSIIRVNEVHNGLCGLLTENVSEQRGGDMVSFDAMWSSSLTDSTSKGMPDIEAVDMTSRLLSVNHIFEVTTKPMIFDGDTGGKLEHFVFTVKSLERLGVSAIVIEDKVGLKKNSLFGNDVFQTQDTIENFKEKISAGKNVQVTDDFMIIARIESLILDAGMDDAINRAIQYYDAGADVIMIHSRKKDPDEIFEFCEKLKMLNPSIPLMVVPSSFNNVTIEEWEKRGVNIVCYANHMLRSAYPSMQNVAKSILKNGRSYEAESSNMCMNIKEILELIPGTK